MVNDDDTFASLDRGLPIPLRTQISAQLRRLISDGEWPAHYRLRPEPELATMLGVSRGTLRNALSTLILEGLLVRVRGRGTYVTSSLLEPAIAQNLSTLSEDFAAQNVSWRTEVLASEITEAPTSVASLLDLSPDTPVFRLTRRGRISTGPVAYLINYVSMDLVPAIVTVDFDTAGLFDTLEHDYGLHIAAGRRTFSAVRAPEVVSRSLDLAEEHPVQYLQQVTYLENGSPVEYSDVWLDSDKLHVTSVLARH